MCFLEKQKNRITKNRNEGVSWTYGTPSFKFPFTDLHLRFL